MRMHPATVQFEHLKAYSVFQCRGPDNTNPSILAPSSRPRPLHHTSVVLISHQSARIHVTRMWTQVQGITHQRREYPSSGTTPHADAAFSLQITSRKLSLQDMRRTLGFKCFSLHSSTFWRRVPGWTLLLPGYRKAFEIHIPSFGPLAAIAVHISSTDL